MMKNVLVMQSGGCTPVLNKSLFGIVREADESKAFGKVYGAGFGLEGVLSGELLNLGKLSRAAWNRIARTPAAALGSTRRKLTSSDVSLRRVDAGEA